MSKSAIKEDARFLSDLTGKTFTIYKAYVIDDRTFDPESPLPINMANDTYATDIIGAPLLAIRQLPTDDPINVALLNKDFKHIKVIIVSFIMQTNPDAPILIDANGNEIDPNIRKDGTFITALNVTLSNKVYKMQTMTFDITDVKAGVVNGQMDCINLSMRNAKTQLEVTMDNNSEAIPVADDIDHDDDDLDDDDDSGDWLTKERFSKSMPEDLTDDD